MTLPAREDRARSAITVGCARAAGACVIARPAMRRTARHGCSRAGQADRRDRGGRRRRHDLVAGGRRSPSCSSVALIGIGAECAAAPDAQGREGSATAQLAARRAGRRRRGLQRHAGGRGQHQPLPADRHRRPTTPGHLMISSFIARRRRDRPAARRGRSCGSIPRSPIAPATTIAVEIAARTIPYGEGAARLLEIRDVGERKHTQERVSFLAHHDPLTALPNRELMRARLDEAVERAGADRHSAARCSGSTSTTSRRSTTSTAT